MSLLNFTTEALLERFGLECAPDTIEVVDGSAVLDRDLYIVTGPISNIPAFVAQKTLRTSRHGSSMQGLVTVDKHTDTASIVFTAKSFEYFLRELELYEENGVAAHMIEDDERSYYDSEPNESYNQVMERFR